MQNPNAVISNVIRFDPPLERPPAEMLRAGEGGVSVELDDGRRIRIDPADERSVGFIQVLDGLRKLRNPVYLEIDPDKGTIARILIPLVTRIVDINSINENEISVELESSHARHVLRRGDPTFEQLEREARERLRGGEPVIVTEDEAHNVIDIRFFRPGPDGPTPIFPDKLLRPTFPRRPLWYYWERIWWWCWWPWWWFRWWRCCVSLTRAQSVFDAMSATSCDPLSVPVQCIPFLYPDDGCWARAHEMCRLMINLGLRPRKVWIQGWLRVDTKNNPNCFVRWGWHVAPTLCVRGPSLFQSQRMVIDPALFTTPVSKATWKGIQGDPNATLTDTAASDYLWGDADPTYVKTNDRLAFYRLRLLNRAIQVGPPPYGHCP
jgi:hypothetical protein